MFSFNSTMVRLKVVTLTTWISFTVMFQFHNGSIKSRTTISPKSSSSQSFNSTMVRLKVSP